MNEAFDALGCIRPEYIHKHEVMARASLENLVERTRIEVLDERMEPSGWFDGMRQLVVDVRTRAGRELTLRWHDGNKGWMKCSLPRQRGEGWVALFAGDLDEVRAA